MGPLEFFNQLRVIVIQGREQQSERDHERLILNREGVRLLTQAITGDVPGGTRLPYAVTLGQPGHVGIVEGCNVFYDPSLDSDHQPIARYHIESDPT